MTVTVKVEKLGPKGAEKLFELNTDNWRKMDSKRVDQYVKEIKRGEWALNGVTIKISKDNVLLDGQHRLLAIMKAGVEVEIIVVRGLECDGRTIDRGKPRSIGQWCNHKGIKNSNAIAAMAKMVLVYSKGLWTKGSIGPNAVIDSEIYDFIEANEPLLQNCHKVTAGTRSLVPASILGAVFYVGCDGRDPADVEEAVWFAKGLKTGEGLSEDDAVLHLRNRMSKESIHAKLDPVMKRISTMIAWNKTVAGEPCNSRGITLRMTGPSKQTPPSKILKVTGI